MDEGDEADEADVADEADDEDEATDNTVESDEEDNGEEVHEYRPGNIGTGEREVFYEGYDPYITRIDHAHTHYHEDT